MKSIWNIALGEWRYWLRSHLALGAALIFLVLILITSVLAGLRMEAETQLRIQQQTEAEETFLAQPDRHPHRMVHYGHYVFRTPAPLAVFDPGLDAVTGQSIFLEGHRQNSVMFPESAASADLGGLSWLSPALVYQLFAPLVLILLGHSAIVRERETGVLASLLAMGISGRQLVAGKALALLSFALLLLSPLLASGGIAVAGGECISSLAILLAVYLTYLAVWIGLILLFSTLFEKRSTVLAAMAGLWFVFALVLPSVAVNIATESAPVAGKIETDLVMEADLRKLGNGHNASDPAFQKLRADTLKKHNVERIEDLPVNYRGMVAMEGERKLTDVLNQYANTRMAAEAQQEKAIAHFGWFTPSLAIAFASRAIAGTDLAAYHRFQREAEEVRFSFVQGLNHAHVHELSYEADVNRNKSRDAFLRARVDSSAWQVLDAFQFQTAKIAERVALASSSIQILLVWLVATLGLLLWCGGRIKP